MRVIIKSLIDAIYSTSGARQGRPSEMLADPRRGSRVGTRVAVRSKDGVEGCVARTEVKGGAEQGLRSPGFILLFP